MANMQKFSKSLCKSHRKESKSCSISHWLALHAELPEGAHSYGSHQPLRDLAIMATDLPLHSSGLSLTGAPLGKLDSPGSLSIDPTDLPFHGSRGCPHTEAHQVPSEQPVWTASRPLFDKSTAEYALPQSSCPWTLLTCPSTALACLRQEFRCVRPIPKSLLVDPFQ